MKRRRAFLNVSVYSGVSLSIVIVACFVNGMLFSSSEIVSPNDALFIEGVILSLIGFMLLLGRGGIDPLSKKAAMLVAAASAVLGADTVGLAEIMRRDSWKSKGFIRAGVVMVVTGILMVAAYSLTLWLTP